MKLVFFDMEFANGQIPGSVYSLGYVETDRKLRLTQPQTDLLINPDCPWNNYVRSHILAYPIKTVQEASLFPAYYKRIKRLLCHAVLAVGFSVKNDTHALQYACQRYGLKPLSFTCLDMEKVCKAYGDYPEAHGLSGYVRAYCGVNPEHQHRSDGDAYATMLLFRAVCEKHGIAPKDAKKKFAAYCIPSVVDLEEEKRLAEEKKQARAKSKRKAYRRYRKPSARSANQAGQTPSAKSGSQSQGRPQGQARPQGQGRPQAQANSQEQVKP